MTDNFLNRFTPRVSARTRILAAAFIWTATGILLTCKGLWFSKEAPMSLLVMPILAGSGLGLLKSRLIFDPVSSRIIAHIGTKPERACLGGLFSFKNWALILMMALFGSTIGAMPLDPSFKTGLYVMVGSGLGFSSRKLWSAWKKSNIHMD
jgi:hypothetical protein